MLNRETLASWSNARDTPVMKQARAPWCISDMRMRALRCVGASSVSKVSVFLPVSSRATRLWAAAGSRGARLPPTTTPMPRLMSRSKLL